MEVDQSAQGNDKKRNQISKSPYTVPEAVLSKSVSFEIYRKVNRRYAGLLVSFVSFPVVLAAIVLLTVYAVEVSETLDRLLVLTMMLSVVMYNVYLGLCAKIIGKSALKWVILNLLFSPFSYTVTMFVMREKVKDELQNIKDAIRVL